MLEKTHGILFPLLHFGIQLKIAFRVAALLVVVLRDADGNEKPTMPEVAALMTEAKEKIRLGFLTQNKKDLLDQILAIIDKC